MSEELTLATREEQTRTTRTVVPSSHTLAHVAQVNDRVCLRFEWGVVLFTLSCGVPTLSRLRLSHDRVELDESV